MDLALAFVAGVFLQMLGMLVIDYLQRHTRGEHRCNCGHRHPCPPTDDGYKYDSP